MAEIYFSGQGTLYGSTRDSAGNTTVFRDFGNVPSLRLTLETETLEHKESRTGQRLTDLRITRERRARITLTLESFTKANLMMMLYGSYQAPGADSSVTNENFPAGLAVGDMVQLAHPFIKSSPLPTITNQAGSTTLVAGTDYTLDYVGGIVTILSTTVTAQPYKANYSYQGEDIVPMFRQSQQERFLRFSGLNTANSDAPTVVELYRVVFDPVGNFDLINDELASYELEGTVLFDTARDTNAALGGFGRIITKA
jgi:hypothetical protein